MRKLPDSGTAEALLENLLLVALFEEYEVKQYGEWLRATGEDVTAIHALASAADAQRAYIYNRLREIRNDQ